MSQGGVRSRVPWGLFACVALGSTAACTALLGISSFEVDPCFDCDGGAPDGPGNETGRPDGSQNPDATTDAPSDSPVDSGPCPCPSGTELVNNICAVTASDASSPASTHCTTPLQMPNCALRVVLHVCDSDPTFMISEPTCIGDGGPTRPTGFIRLGTAPGGTWKMTVNAAYSVSAPNGICTTGGMPCKGDGTSTTAINTTNAGNGSVIAIGKRTDPDVTPCQDIDITTEPN